MSTRDTLAAIGRLVEFRTAQQRMGDRKRAEKLKRRGLFLSMKAGKKIGGVAGSIYGGLKLGAQGFKESKGRSLRKRIKHTALGARIGARAGRIAGKGYGAAKAGMIYANRFGR